MYRRLQMKDYFHVNKIICTFNVTEKQLHCVFACALREHSKTSLVNIISVNNISLCRNLNKLRKDF